MKDGVMRSGAIALGVFLLAFWIFMAGYSTCARRKGQLYQEAIKANAGKYVIIAGTNKTKWVWNTCECKSEGVKE